MSVTLSQYYSYTAWPLLIINSPPAQDIQTFRSQASHDAPGHKTLLHDTRQRKEVFIYSPSYHSKSVWGCFFCGTQREAIRERVTDWNLGYWWKISPQLSNLILYAAYSNYYIILGFNTQELIAFWPQWQTCVKSGITIQHLKKIY